MASLAGYDSANSNSSDDLDGFLDDFDSTTKTTTRDQSDDEDEEEANSLRAKQQVAAAANALNTTKHNITLEQLESNEVTHAILRRSFSVFLLVSKFDGATTSSSHLDAIADHLSTLSNTFDLTSFGIVPDPSTHIQSHFHLDRLPSIVCCVAGSVVGKTTRLEQFKGGKDVGERLTPWLEQYRMIGAQQISQDALQRVARQTDESRAEAYDATNFTSSSPAESEPTVRPAASDDSISDLTMLINNAYKVGEAGIMVDNKENPFFRMLEEDVSELVNKENLFVLVSTTLSSSSSSFEPGDIIGCVKIDKNVDETSEGERVGEWGGLAVHPDYQNKGYGTLLQAAAERALKDAGCIVAQLELLTPSNWEHAHKERLRQWYVEKLGYSLKVPGDYEKSTTSMPKGTRLLERFLLATASDFTVYRRKIP